MGKDRTEKILHSEHIGFAYRKVSVTMRISQDTFRQVVEQHQRMVYGIAVRLLGDPGEAEEVAQDVFLELYDAQDKLQGDDHVKFWLRRVAVHRTTDALRRRGHRPEASADEWEDSLHDFSKPVEDHEVADRLEELVRTLPEPYRTAVVLRYADEASPDEIAAILGRPVATVKSHLQRGLGMLRQKADVMMREWTR